MSSGDPSATHHLGGLLHKPSLALSPDGRSVGRCPAGESFLVTSDVLVIRPKSGSERFIQT